MYFLSQQMGTSVKMIADHYGRITPTKNADRILLGMPGWEPVAAAPEAAIETGHDAPGSGENRTAKPKTKPARDG